MQPASVFYDHLLNSKPEILKRVATMVDEGKTSEEIARVIGNTNLRLGMIVFFAANHMKISGVRPEKDGAK